MTGKTIRKEMKADNFDDVSQTRHNTIKEATGTVFIVVTNGRRNISNNLKHFAAMAKTVPRINPEKNPIDIRRKEKEIVLQNSFFISRIKNLFRTSTGDGSSIFDFTIIERTYHTVRTIIIAPTV